MLIDGDDLLIYGETTAKSTVKRTSREHVSNKYKVENTEKVNQDLERKGCLPVPKVVYSHEKGKAKHKKCLPF